MTGISRLLASAAVLAAAAPASAATVVLSFDQYNVGSSTTATTSIYGPIVEDGFRLTSSLCEAPSQGRPLGRCFVTAQRQAETSNSRSIDRSTTSAAIKTSYQGQTITLEQLNGEAFTFSGIDVKSSYGSNDVNVDFKYTLATGQTGSTRFLLPTLNADPDGTTLTLANIGPITRLQFDPVESNGAFQFDNIRVAPVPEPGEWAMMIGGLSVVGAVARRRKARG